jgi:hypothetical protein
MTAEGEMKMGSSGMPNQLQGVIDAVAFNDRPQPKRDGGSPASDILFHTFVYPFYPIKLTDQPFTPPHLPSLSIYDSSQPHTTHPPKHETMAKSIRAKAKMANRKKKREQGNYHAADAARVARLSAKLLGKQKEEGDDEEMVDEEAKQPEEDAEMSMSILFL